MRLLLLASIIFLLASCGNSDEQQKQLIEAAIQQDLENGLSDSLTLELDLPNLPQTKYTAEKEHSSISFRTKHWEIVDLIGWFSDFDIVMYADSADFSDAVIYGKVFPNSIKMPNPKMMGSVKNPPYIDTEQSPEAIFFSDKFQPVGNDRYLLTGTLTLNGIEQPMTFDVTFNGFAYPDEKPIHGFDVTGKINRHDFKIAGLNKLHSGRLIHDDSIELNLALRME